MKTLLLTAFTVCLSFFSSAQTKPAGVQLVNPANVVTPRGYSHAAIIDLGNCRMVMIAGQVALDKEGNLVGKGDMEKQAEQVFRNIKTIVESAGGTMNDIVKTNYYLTDIKGLAAVRTVRDRFVDTTRRPVSTLVQVSSLYREDVMIEVEATAVIPGK